MLFLPVASTPGPRPRGALVAPEHSQRGSAGQFGSSDGFADVDSPEPWVGTGLSFSPRSAALALARGWALQGGCGRAAPVPGGAGGGGKLLLEKRGKSYVRSHPVMKSSGTDTAQPPISSLQTVRSCGDVNFINHLKTAHTVPPSRHWLSANPKVCPVWQETCQEQ